MSGSTLLFIESDEYHSTYLDSRTREEVYLEHGTRKRLVPLHDLHLTTMWQQYRFDTYLTDTYAWDVWIEDLRGMVIERDEVDELERCADCHAVGHEQDYCTVNGSKIVCEPCYDDYWTCERCDGRFHETTTTLYDTELCAGCLSSYYSHCSDCEGYYLDSCADEHQHGRCSEDGYGCDSPAKQFRVRNNGDGWLDNDSTFSIALPAGHISDEGIEQIRLEVRVYANTLAADSPEESQRVWGLSYQIHKLGAEWQTREGNFTKRLGRMAYKEAKVKLPAELISKIGCIARDQSQPVDFEIATTRELNMSAYDFGHEDSCWWQSYYHSRCALKSNGGFGLRTFSDRYNEVTGRSWVIPLRLNGATQVVYTSNGKVTKSLLTPTFDTETPDAFIVFNGYGDLEGYTAARIMSHMAGMTYRKVSFSCDINTDPNMYINSDSGYLVAPEEIAEPYTDGHLDLTMEQHSDLYETEQNRLTLTAQIEENTNAA